MVDSEVLRSIWPPVLTFRASDKVINLLLKPDIAGKPFSLDGSLNISDRIYQVYSATEVVEKKEKKEKKK